MLSDDMLSEAGLFSFAVGDWLFLLAFCIQVPSPYVCVNAGPHSLAVSRHFACYHSTSAPAGSFPNAPPRSGTACSAAPLGIAPCPTLGWIRSRAPRRGQRRAPRPLRWAVASGCDQGGRQRPGAAAFSSPRFLLLGRPEHAQSGRESRAAAACGAAAARGAAALEPGHSAAGSAWRCQPGARPADVRPEEGGGGPPFPLPAAARRKFIWLRRSPARRPAEGIGRNPPRCAWPGVSSRPYSLAAACGTERNGWGGPARRSLPALRARGRGRWLQCPLRRPRAGGGGRAPAAAPRAGGGAAGAPGAPPAATPRGGPGPAEGRREGAGAGCLWASSRGAGQAQPPSPPRRAVTVHGGAGSAEPGAGGARAAPPSQEGGRRGARPPGPFRSPCPMP